MKFTDIFFLIKKRLLETRNIILFFIIVVIFLILFTCITITNFSKSNKNEIYNSEIARSLYVFESKDGDVEEKINEVDNIEYFFSNKYLSPERFEIKEFDDEISDGIILIKALIKDDIKIMSGKNITADNEMICSNYFYPHEYDDKLYSEQFLKGKDIINKNIIVDSDNEDNIDEKVSLNIVGTYKNKYMEEANTCYVNIETYDKIASKYMGRSLGYDKNGNLTSIEYNKYEDYIVVVDDIKNMQDVEKKLNELGIGYEEVSRIKLEFINILYTTIVVIIVLLLFCGSQSLFLDLSLW